MMCETHEAHAASFLLRRAVADKYTDNIAQRTYKLPSVADESQCGLCTIQQLKHTKPYHYVAVLSIGWPIGREGLRGW
jgi:hypothetical protein